MSVVNALYRIEVAEEVLEKMKSEFASLKEELQERESHKQNMESESTKREQLVIIDSEQNQMASDESIYITIATKKFSYPTPSQQIERAVWRNIEFCKYLTSLGLSGCPVLTSLVTNWFKRFWFGDERLGPKRLLDAGFTKYEMLHLTTHHIVPNDLGGADSVYNYHLVLRNINSHFGELFTRESIAWVGVEHAHVAKSFCKFAKNMTHDDLNGQKFDPFRLQCPRTAIKKRRIVVHDTETQPKQVCVEGVQDFESLQYASIHNVNPTPVKTPFEWRRDWFKENYCIRVDVSQRAVDALDCMICVSGSDGSGKALMTKHLGAPRIEATAAKMGFQIEEMKSVTWTGIKTIRRTIHINAMVKILKHVNTQTSNRMSVDLSTFLENLCRQASTQDTALIVVDDIENERIVPELEEHTVVHDTETLTEIEKRKIVVHDTETLRKPVRVYTPIVQFDTYWSWRQPWFPPDHCIRLCLKTKYVDTADVFRIISSSLSASRVANSKYLGEGKLESTAASLGFNPKVLRTVNWHGKGWIRKILPLGVMKTIIKKFNTACADELLLGFSKLVEDIENERIVPELEEHTYTVS